MFVLNKKATIVVIFLKILAVEKANRIFDRNQSHKIFVVDLIALMLSRVDQNES